MSSTSDCGAACSVVLSKDREYCRKEWPPGNLYNAIITKQKGTQGRPFGGELLGLGVDEGPDFNGRHAAAAEEDCRRQPGRKGSIPLSRHVATTFQWESNGDR